MWVDVVGGCYGVILKEREGREREERKRKRRKKEPWEEKSQWERLLDFEAIHLFVCEQNLT